MMFSLAVFLRLVVIVFEGLRVGYGGMKGIFLLIRVPLKARTVL